jgi:PCFT/HCP family folate transporter-like MFS transporter 1/3
VIYLFTRLKFLWNEVDFSIFATYQAVTSMIGTLLAVGVLSYYLKIHDCLVGIVGSISEISASFIYTFAKTVRNFYFAPLADIFSNASAISMRSMTSKVVENEERGQLNSLFGVVEALTPSLYAPVYAKIYKATIHTLPGAFFLVGGGLRIFAVVIFM